VEVEHTDVEEQRVRRADQGTAGSARASRVRGPAIVAAVASVALVLLAAVPAGAAGRSDELSRPSSLQPTAASSDNGGAVTGPATPTTTPATRVIVKYRPSATGSARVRSLSSHGLRVRRTLRLTGAKLVDVPRGRSASDVAAQLRRDPAVEYAVPDVLRRPLANAVVPNDPHFSQQWGLRNTGQTLAASAESDVTPVAGVDVDALGAWGVASGSASVTVAVIDQGVDISHPDLQDAIWTNRREIPGNGRDDDGNGYVDDVHGWDFVRGSGVVDGAQDDDDHGTHVAGIVGATRDNDEGIAGLASGVRIMPLKFMGADGGYDSDAIDAIAYAKAMGAKVINASWGASVGDDPLADDPDLRDAITQCGCVFVAAAGNDGASSDDPDARIFPAAFGLPNELSVGALDASGQLASFSNYGNGVDLAAPGDAILSTLPGGYGWGGGTSMAAPFVSATAALMLSLAPTLSPEEVVARIEASVTRLPGLSGKVRSGGMLDAGAAMCSLAARVAPERLQGVDRYATAAAVSTKFTPGVAVAYVASGESFPDALAGAALAGSHDAPVLLTAAGKLPTATVTALKRLQPGRIVVLGGEGAVSGAVAGALEGYTDGDVTRIQGSDRYATASAIAREMMTGVSTDVVYVASGQSFPDALAGAALAGSTGQPVLLTSTSTLPTATAARLSALRPSRIVVLGGPGAVSNAVRDRLRDYTSGTVTRIYGADRYATAAAVAGQFGTGVPSAYVASGLGFPDALAGAALAGSQGSPVLLTARTSVPLATRDRLARLGTSKVVVLGGTGVVSSATATTLGVIAAG
jgi:subtilisin family serine protease/putative cell wall-binding protein